MRRTDVRSHIVSYILAERVRWIHGGEQARERPPAYVLDVVLCTVGRHGGLAITIGRGLCIDHGIKDVAIVLTTVNIRPPLDRSYGLGAHLRRSGNTEDPFRARLVYHISIS